MINDSANPQRFETTCRACDAYSSPAKHTSNKYPPAETSRHSASTLLEHHSAGGVHDLPPKKYKYIVPAWLSEPQRLGDAETHLKSQICFSRKLNRAKKGKPRVSQAFWGHEHKGGALPKAAASLAHEQPERRNGCILSLALLKRCDLLFCCDGLALSSWDFPLWCVSYLGRVLSGFFSLVVSLNDGCGLCLQSRQLYSSQAQHLAVSLYVCNIQVFLASYPVQSDCGTEQNSKQPAIQQ